jgi:hypothetical protein
MLDDQTIQRIKDSFRTMTDEEHDEIIEEMIRDGILDREGNVLKRFPEPPDWLTQANGQPAPAETRKQTKPAKKSKRPRKRS